MPKPAFDITALSQYASAESIRRGREYYRKGAVDPLVLRGDKLRADVEDSQICGFARPASAQIQIDTPDGGVMI